MQPALNFLPLLGVPALQATAQFGKRGGQDKHRHAAGHALHHLQRALRIDIQHHVLAVGQRFHDGLTRRAVVMPMHRRVFQKAILGHHALEFLFINKVIIAAIYLAGAGRTGGVADRKGHGRIIPEQLSIQRTLARARRAGDHQQHTLAYLAHINAPLQRLIYSTF